MSLFPDQIQFVFLCFRESWLDPKAYLLGVCKSNEFEHGVPRERCLGLVLNKFLSFKQQKIGGFWVDKVSVWMYVV